MKQFTKFLPILITALIFSINITGCVNVIQKTVLNPDGSGSMNIKYWTKTSNIAGDELDIFGFTEEKVKANYSSPNCQVSDVQINKDETSDSLSVVTLNLKFKNINKLSDSKSFSKIQASYGKGENGMEFKYTLLQDTSNANMLGASDYKLVYEFVLPSDIIYTTGKKDGRTVTWKKTLADLKEDVDFMAYLKAE